MIRTDVDPASNIVYQTALNKVTWPMILEAMGRAMQHPESGRCDRSLWDFTGAKPEISFAEVDAAIAGLHNAISGRLNRRRMAWVASTELDKSILEIFLGMFDWGVEWHVFRTQTEAFLWLDVTDRPTRAEVSRRTH